MPRRPRRMACTLTIPAVRARTKRVTRRRADTWTDLAVGDRLVLIEKGMGLKKGEHQVVLDEVEIVDVRVEPIGQILTEADGTRLEGLDEMDPFEFIVFWLRHHGHTPPPGAAWDSTTLCRRIEWRYLDDPDGGGPP